MVRTWPWVDDEIVENSCHTLSAVDVYISTGGSLELPGRQ